MSRRLWWRFLGQGSGKSTCTAVKESDGRTKRSRKRASVWISRRLGKRRRCALARATRKNRPARSTPRKSLSASDSAERMRNRPLPQPISSSTGRGRPKMAGKGASSVRSDRWISHDGDGVPPAATASPGGVARRRELSGSSRGFTRGRSCRWPGTGWPRRDPPIRADPGTADPCASSWRP